MQPCCRPLLVALAAAAVNCFYRFVCNFDFPAVRAASAFAPAGS
jgi:hypothetical protein